MVVLFNHIIKLLTLFFISKKCYCETETNLLSVIVIYRHGDRAPIKTYPNDPYKDLSYWPMGFGQLTKIGKMQQYDLGQWLRNRYKNFLSDEFSNNEIRVRSTDVDRTLMSAQCNLAGLFPPDTNQTWNLNLKWQPIPIHTIPEKLDCVLAMKKPCEKYKQLVLALLNTPEFLDIQKRNHDLYSYLTRNSGLHVNSLETLQTVYNALFIERLYNLTLPQWTKSVFPDKMKVWSALSFATSTYTPELAHLRTGPFFNEIYKNFQNASRKTGPKMYMYSAHDTTIADVLNSLNLFEKHSPPYTATILFELRSINRSMFVNVFYKNTTVLREMILNGCDFNCPLDKFNEILDLIRLNNEEWEFACQAKFLGFVPFTTLQTSVFIGCMGLLFLLICSFIVSLVWSRRRRTNINYLRIPNQED